MSSAPAPRSTIPATRLWPLSRGTVASMADALRRRARPGDDLDEARELLAYWERRARRLPRWSLLRRREARAMARVWRERVADAERLRYGAGVLGAASLYATERRLPATATHRCRQAVRTAAWTAATLTVTLVLLFAAALAVVAETLLGAL